jgi:hypothetical protein
MTDPSRKVTHARLFGRLATVNMVKRAAEFVAFHRLAVDEIVPDPLHGQSDEHDRITAAFTEIYYLDQRVRAEAAEIFARHGLGDHGLAATIETHYVPEWDKTREP